MHADEYRDLNSIRKLRLAEATTESGHIRNRYESRIGLTQESYINQLEAERDELQRQVRSARAALEEIRLENTKLSNQRALAEQRLKTVRDSRTFRVGKAAISPAQATRKLVNGQRRNVLKIEELLKASLRRARSTIRKNFSPRRTHTDSVRIVVKQGIDNNGANGGFHDKPLSSTTNRDVLPGPVEQFELKQSVRSFDRALKHLWFTEGKIFAAKALVENNPKFVEKLGDSSKSLAFRILGEARINPSEIVPERSPDPAYVAEPRRVMYCIHQSPVYNSNGYSTRTRGVASGIKAAGGDVVVVSRSGYPWDSRVDIEKPKTKRSESILDGIQYVHVPGGNLNRDPIDRYVLQCADAFVREARMIRPTILQAASNFKTALPALIAARRLGIPFVYEVRGFWEITEASANAGFQETERFEAMRSLETMVAKNADRILAITPQVKDELVARGVNPENINVAPNSVDPEVFLPLPKDIKYARSKGIRVDVPVIGFAGSIVGYEGLDVLVEASGALRARGVEHQVVIAGSGAAEASIKERIANLTLQNQVLLLGRLPQDEMPRLHSTFDIAVCPRRSTRVTELVSPLKPLESFATGKATVLSNVAPNKDLAGEDETRALLCNADDVESLSEQLEKFILSADLRADFGRTARLWVVAERSWASLGKSMIDAHKIALEDAGKRKRDRCAKPLHTLRVGVIGDEFTRSALEDAFCVTWLSRKNWKSQLDSEPDFDLIFVESAWEGNGGEWWRGVGHYSDEESRDLRSLLSVAREKDIPSIFWNKEDPVHFSRFAPNAAFFDHVFTTDACMIPRYLNAKDSYNKTVSALPFFAQPKLHNPMPSAREFKNSVAYAGSYYGDRFKDRSEALESLLAASTQFGLDIYDRQANNPDSPYKFPKIYRNSVRGGLPYRETVESYNSHIAHLNVNSVFNSPTMFSRRVVEIPASGGIVMSAYGRGIAETIGSNIAQSDSPEDYRAWLYEWAANPAGRLEEIWRQMRTVYRSHTTESALSILARTAGIPVVGVEPQNYTAVLEVAEALTATDRLSMIKRVASQSVPPQLVIVPELTEPEAEVLDRYGIKSTAKLGRPIKGSIEVFFPIAFSRTFAEDVLLPLRFGEFSNVYLRKTESFTIDSSVANPMDHGNTEVLPLVVRNAQATDSRSIAVTLPLTPENKLSSNLKRGSFELSDKTILIAGHDLKFAGAMVDKLLSSGCKVLFDKWDGHNKHNLTISEELLTKADIVFCEWGLGNAVWYSENLQPHQSMAVRVHSQELFLPFLDRINHSKVNKYIFVGELIRQAAITSHGVPADKTVVVPNLVDINSLDRPKADDASKTLGMVGIVPMSKRVDRALDLLESLLALDSEYKLRIKGRTPEDIPWMKNRPNEMKYYAAQYQRIESINRKWPSAVTFDGYGTDMAEWYRHVEIVLSTSDFESFHLTLADGAASGAVPVGLNWPGADLIYPLTWLSGDTDGMVRKILKMRTNINEVKEVASTKFDQNILLDKLISILGESAVDEL